MIFESVTDEFGYTYIRGTQSDGKTLTIPLDPANSDYQAYLRWLEDPNADEFQPPLEG